MHEDHYENLFYVLSGEKEFTLCPPADVLFLYERDFESGSFCRSGEGWVVSEDNLQNACAGPSSPTFVKWIEPNIDAELYSTKEMECFPLTKHTHPFKIKVKAGEMLYLPSLWFHSVTQTCETVGLNYWYDMKFDVKWCYFNFLQNLASKKAHKSKSAQTE